MTLAMTPLREQAVICRGSAWPGRCAHPGAKDRSTRQYLTERTKLEYPETRRARSRTGDEVRRTSRNRRHLVGAIALAATLALAGCATSVVAGAAVGSAAPKPEHSVAPLPAVQSAPNSGTDAETCVAMGDVVAIVLNADVAVREGRMSSQEQGGWHALATRVLARVPTTGAGQVSETVVALQAVVPPVPLLAFGRGEIGSSEWVEQWSAVYQSCADAGSEIVQLAFTGG